MQISMLMMFLFSCWWWWQRWTTASAVMMMVMIMSNHRHGETLQTNNGPQVRHGYANRQANMDIKQWQTQRYADYIILMTHDNQTEDMWQFCIAQCLPPWWQETKQQTASTKTTNCMELHSQDPSVIEVCSVNASQRGYKMLPRAAIQKIGYRTWNQYVVVKKIHYCNKNTCFRFLYALRPLAMLLKHHQPYEGQLTMP